MTLFPYTKVVLIFFFVFSRRTLYGEKLSSLLATTIKNSCFSFAFDNFFFIYIYIFFFLLRIRIQNNIYHRVGHSSSAPVTSALDLRLPRVHATSGCKRPSPARRDRSFRLRLHTWKHPFKLGPQNLLSQKKWILKRRLLVLPPRGKTKTCTEGLLFFFLFTYGRLDHNLLDKKGTAVAKRGTFNLLLGQKVL